MKLTASVILQIIVIVALLYAILKMAGSEKLCVRKSYGVVTDIPVSALATANLGLVSDSSLGQAPLGDPRYWIAPKSPITQGQYGLYLPELPLAEAQNFDPKKVWAPILAEMPVYTQKPLSGQCTRLR